LCERHEKGVVMASLTVCCIQDLCERHEKGVVMASLTVCLVQDLCERHEKGVVSEHQKTMQKLNQYKKKTNAVSHSHSAVS